MRVLVLGGTGNFGARIVHALQHDPHVDLWIAAPAALGYSRARILTIV